MCLLLRAVIVGRCKVAVQHGPDQANSRTPLSVHTDQGASLLPHVVKTGLRWRAVPRSRFCLPLPRWGRRLVLRRCRLGRGLGGFCRGTGPLALLRARPPFPGFDAVVRGALERRRGAAL